MNAQAIYTPSAQLRKVQRILYRRCRSLGLELDGWPFQAHGHWYACHKGNCQRMTDVLNMEKVQ